MTEDLDVIVWSKPNCPECVKAKKLLETKGIVYTEKSIGNGYDRDDLLAILPEAKSVPQIFVNNQHVGGYVGLQKFLS